jgi:hypothetical protein
MFLPAEIIPVLAHFAPVFTTPTYQKALILIVGTLLASVHSSETKVLTHWPEAIAIFCSR